MDPSCVVTFALALALFLGAGYFYALTWRIRRDTQKHLNDAKIIQESTQESLAEGERVNQSTVDLLAQIRANQQHTKF